jgi:hypothetical protein
MSEKETNKMSDEISQINNSMNKLEDINKIIEWVSNLKNPELRVNALVELSKQRDSFSDLAIYLWFSPGIISAL